MQDIISKFTGHLKSVLTRALTLVIEQQGEEILPEHLLWALGTQQGSVAQEILVKSGLQSTDLQTFIDAWAQRNSETEKQRIPILSDTSKLCIEKAVLTANLHQHRYVGTEHLLSSLVDLHQPSIDSFLKEVKVQEKTLQDQLQTIFSSTAAFPHVPEQAFEHPLESFLKTESNQEEDTGDKQLAIDFFTDDLTDPETAASIDPVIGREKEIERLMHVVARRTKSNPILIGEPGVGKTAIVEGFAKKIVEGDVPPALQGTRVHQLDLASMVAGTMYRGEFESRLKQLIEEIEERPNVILFIDELHTIMGTGAASGSLDTANMLKPALARGTIRCIGSTTPAEYKRHIETDGALERRFQAIRVEEPDKSATVTILKGIKEHYESHHRVVFKDEAIERAVHLADQYLPNLHFPDKAIDILDETGAAAAMRHKGVRQQQADLDDLEASLKDIQSKKQQAVEEERFEKAIELKEEERRLLKQKKEATSPTPKPTTISTDDIDRTVERLTGIPIRERDKKVKQELQSLAANLERQVVGQSSTIQHVAKAIARAKLGIAPKGQPLTSLLFIGPSGVGKTELAKVIAKEVYGNPASLLRLDMSEFSERYTISKLLGSPAGYVGYREKSLLSDHIKQYPHSVVLFDEIEKAHRDVHHLLLQLLEEGEITDATGKTVNFRHTIIILTSNVGRELFQGSQLGFGDAEASLERNKAVKHKAQEVFSPELLNRLQHIAVFQPLEQEHLEHIAHLQLSELKNRLGEAGVQLTIPATTARNIATLVRPAEGGRGVKRVIEEHIEHPLTEKLLSSRGSSHRYKVQHKKTTGFSILHKNTSS